MFECAEGRGVEDRLRPHVEAAEAYADERAVFRPERLDVAHALEVAANVAVAPARLVIGEFVALPAGGEGGRDGLGRLHAGEHGVVRTLDARDVDEAGRAADEAAAGEDELRHRLPAAFHDRAGTVSDALGALEHVADHRVGLEALELLERRQGRVLVVQMRDEADREQVIVKMVEPGAAAGLVRKRPAHGVAHETRLERLRLELPEFLDAEAILLVIAVPVQLEAVDQRLGERAARALAEDRVLAAQLHTAGVVVPRFAGPADAEIPGGHADDGTGIVVEHFRGRKAWIDLDAEFLGLGAEILRHVRERADEITVVRHEFRESEVRQRDAAVLGQEQELVALDLGLERPGLVLTPIGEQSVEPERIDHGAGQDMRADLGPLLDHDDGEIGGDLLEADRGGKASGPRTDDHHVEIHTLALGQRHPINSSCRATRNRSRPAVECAML